MILTMIGTWNVNDKGSRGSPLSRSEVIRHELEGMTTPSAFINAFLWVGHDWITSNVDIEAGD